MAPRLDRVLAAQRDARLARERSRRLLAQRAVLLDRQRRLRLARCGPDFRIFGFAQRPERAQVDVREGEVPVILLVGEVDLASSDTLRRHLDAIAVDHDSVVVDLTDTVFVDSSVVHELVRAQRAGLDVAIRGRGSAARRAIELMGLDAVFRMDD